MNAPQIIMIVIYAMGVTVSLLKHGETRTGTYNFWLTFISTMIECAILKWGGFFK